MSLAFLEKSKPSRAKARVVGVVPVIVILMESMRMTRVVVVTTMRKRRRKRGRRRWVLVWRRFRDTIESCWFFFKEREFHRGRGVFFFFLDRVFWCVVILLTQLTSRRGSSLNLCDSSVWVFPFFLPLILIGMCIVFLLQTHSPLLHRLLCRSDHSHLSSSFRIQLQFFLYHISCFCDF